MRPGRVRLVLGLGLSLLAPATAFAQAPVTPQVQIKVDFTTTGAADVNVLLFAELRAHAARFLEKLSRGKASAIQAPTPGRWSARRSGRPPPGFSLFRASCPPIGAALRYAENPGRRPASTQTVRSRCV